jgi:hypothetical protein
MLTVRHTLNSSGQNYAVKDRVMVTDSLSYYWSCIGTVDRVEDSCVRLVMDIDGRKVRRSTCLEFVGRGEKRDACQS